VTAARPLTTTSVLSYWRAYFDPGQEARLANHSTGLIAGRLHRLLSGLGPVTYFDFGDEPAGLEADLFVGHFWAFASMCERNRFRRRIAVYVLSDPSAAREMLRHAAEEGGVPMPDWDLPPVSFDHDTTMEQADLVLVCGNSHTLATFPSRWQAKIRLFDYALDERLWESAPAAPRLHDHFVYVATHCGLRKGFLDVIATWGAVPPEMARLHVVGQLDQPYEARLREANTGSVVVHGWMDSATDRYRRLLQSCQFAYIPTWVEGQMGTMLEAIFAGCIPITTAACGIHDDVLAHCVVVEPKHPRQHLAAIQEALKWSPAECQRRSTALLETARRRHNWQRFDTVVGSAIAELFETGTAPFREETGTHVW
jgi:glycosyltransferase involved in cell wall biosynthesis